MSGYIGPLLIFLQISLLACQESRPLHAGSEPGKADVCVTCQSEESQWDSTGAGQGDLQRDQSKTTVLSTTTVIEHLPQRKKVLEEKQEHRVPGINMLHYSRSYALAGQGSEIYIGASFGIINDWNKVVFWIGPDGKNMTKQNMQRFGFGSNGGFQYSEYSTGLVLSNFNESEGATYGTYKLVMKDSDTSKPLKDGSHISFHVNDKVAKLEVEHEANAVVSWYDQHGKRVQTSNKYMIESLDKHTRLLINNLQIQDDGVYGISLTNGNKTKIFLVTLSVVGTQDVKITTNKYITSGTQLEYATCQVYSNPRPQFTWITTNDRELGNHTMEEIRENHYLSKLWYQPGVPSVYPLSCIADNLFDRAQVNETIYRTNVKNGFDILSKEKSHVGDDVNLTCYTDIESYSHFINWKLPSDGIKFSSDERGNSKSLIIKNVTKEMSGEYVCNIFDSVNNVLHGTKTVTLNVMDHNYLSTIVYSSVAVLLIIVLIAAVVSYQVYRRRRSSNNHSLLTNENF